MKRLRLRVGFVRDDEFSLRPDFDLRRREFVNGRSGYCDFSRHLLRAGSTLASQQFCREDSWCGLIIE